MQETNGVKEVVAHGNGSPADAKSPESKLESLKDAKAISSDVFKENQK